MSKVLEVFYLKNRSKIFEESKLHNQPIEVFSQLEFNLLNNKSKGVFVTFYKQKNRSECLISSGKYYPSVKELLSNIRLYDETFFRSIEETLSKIIAKETFDAIYNENINIDTKTSFFNFMFYDINSVTENDYNHKNSKTLSQILPNSIYKELLNNDSRFDINLKNLMKYISSNKKNILFYLNSYRYKDIEIYTSDKTIDLSYFSPFIEIDDMEVTFKTKENIIFKHQKIYFC